MARLIRILGRLTGKAIRSHAFDRAISVAADYVVTEMRLTDLRAKRTLLKRKRTNHLRILGRTVHRLLENGVEPMETDQVRTILRVLGEIEDEIGTVEGELERRQEAEREKRRQRAERSSPHTRDTRGGKGRTSGG